MLEIPHQTPNRPNVLELIADDMTSLNACITTVITIALRYGWSNEILTAQLNRLRTNSEKINKKIG